MNTIDALYNRVKALNIEQVAVASVTETKERIGDLNAEQMYSGIRADGSLTSPSYSLLTVQIKKSKGQPVDRVTLRDTGAFYQGIKVDVTGLRINITSTDPKTGKLEKKYSKANGGIFGLSPKFKGEYIREDLRPVFVNRIALLTGLKFSK